MRSRSDNDLGGLPVDHEQIYTCREEDPYQRYSSGHPPRLFCHDLMVYHQAAGNASHVVDPLLLFRLPDLHLFA